MRKTVHAEPVVVPDKLYFRIGDVARLCDVPAYVLRFWETEFPQLKPNKGGTGQRLYRKRDVEIALRIKTLLYDEGYTIPGARVVLKGDGPRAEPEAVLQTIVVANTESLDIGAQIREQAKYRDQLATLRVELASVAAMLAQPPSPTAAVAELLSPLAHKHSPMRPRLVLEPTLKPQISLNQGDLFPAE